MSIHQNLLSEGQSGPLLANERDRPFNEFLHMLGGEIIELTPEERAAFIEAVKPLHDEARETLGPETFKLLDDARSGL